MQKLKKQKFYNLLNYKHFLKNNNLKNNKFKLKKQLFESQLLLKNMDFNIIELNNYENIYIPLTVLNLNNIYTIKNKYENQLLFNYNLNYNILYYFNSIILKNIIYKNNNIIKGRVIGENNKKVLVSILGIIFSMKSFNLNNLINKKKKNYFNKRNKYKISSKNIFKKIQLKRLVNGYKLRYLNFKIDIIKKIKQKIIISRTSYLYELMKKRYFKKKKSILSRKLYLHKKSK